MPAKNDLNFELLEKLQKSFKEEENGDIRKRILILLLLMANRLFKSIEELEYLLHHLLDEGELVINWGRKIKNKCNVIITV
jgi:hypothetical protein